MPAAPRVLQVITRDGVGGTEHMVATLVERADPAQVNMDVVILDSPGPVAGRLRASGVAVQSLGAGVARPFARLARILATEHYEVVNAYGFRATLVTRFL